MTEAMTAVDLLIRKGKVVTPDCLIEASIAIKDGCIIAVGSDAVMPPAEIQKKVESYLLNSQALQHY